MPPDTEVIEAKPVSIEPLSETARQEESEIVALRDEIEVNFLVLGKRLSSFAERKLWDGLGYRSMDAWLDSDRVQIGRRTGWRLIGVWRAFGQCGVPPVTLAEAGHAKLAIVAPKVTEEQMDPEDAVMLATEYSRRELEQRFRKSRPDTPAHNKVTCPTCGSKVSPDALNDGVVLD